MQLSEHRQRFTTYMMSTIKSFNQKPGPCPTHESRVIFDRNESDGLIWSESVKKSELIRFRIESRELSSESEMSLLDVLKSNLSHIIPLTQTK